MWVVVHTTYEDVELLYLSGTLVRCKMLEGPDDNTMAFKAAPDGDVTLFRIYDSLVAGCLHTKWARVGQAAFEYHRDAMPAYEQQVRMKIAQYTKVVEGYRATLKRICELKRGRGI